MTFTILEQILAHVSFPSLLFATIFYWGKSIYINSEVFDILGRISVIIASSCTTVFLSTRWIFSNHFPLSNLYESSMFLSWNLTLVHLLLGSRSRNNWLGLITAPSAMLAHGFATSGLPSEMQESVPLVPALQSHWLMMHVTTMILSYSTLLCGSLLATSLLIVAATKSRNFAPIKSHVGLLFLNPSISSKSDIYSHKSEKSLFFVNYRKWQLIEELDNWSYRIISVGFPSLTIGILAGAVWANEAWGSYWNWDPKETWALITWLIFATYLHTRMIKGWRREESAIIASLGFFTIWICYLGVNSLGKGLHNYGWLL